MKRPEFNNNSCEGGIDSRSKAPIDNIKCQFITEGGVFYDTLKKGLEYSKDNNVLIDTVHVQSSFIRCSRCTNRKIPRKY